jgi:gliding motility-associated-like protein
MPDDRLNTKLVKFSGIIALVALWQLSALAQVCSGNLGENIFPDGDFGSGNTNVVSTDPQIAPGYTYQPHPPPNDGYYTITNYTGLWNLFPGWIKIYDNSPDNFGYMMVVNASHEPGLFYEEEITGLCENTLYEFSVDIINLLNKNANIILPNVSFLLDGDEKYNSGDVPEDEEWHTYGFTFTTDPGQSSLTLSLQNNAPGGMGNDLALDNISFRPCGPEALILPEEVTDICEDGNPIELQATLIGNAFTTPTFQWQQSLDGGVSWENIDGETGDSFTHSNLAGGNYFYRYLVANGQSTISNYKCRIVSNEKRIRVIPKYKSITDSICQGLTYTVGNSFYSSSGIYTDTLLNRLGCDSIVTLNLTVVEDIGLSTKYQINNPSCSYTSDGSFKLDTVLNGQSPFSFFFDGKPYQIDEVVSQLPGGDYLYSVTDRYSCGFEETVTIEPPLPFIINLGPDQEIDLGDVVVLIPESNFEVNTYHWEPAELINCNSDCLELEWAPPYSMAISATGSSSKNCIADASVYVTVNKVRKAYFPNAFTPNGDGLNDYFSVFGAIPNVKLVKKMAVYNRWGELVYEEYNFVPNEPTAGWDGTFLGKPLEPGAFVYQVETEFLDGEVINYKGIVMLVR